MGSERNIHIDGDAFDIIAITGDNNTVVQNFPGEQLSQIERILDQLKEQQARSLQLDKAPAWLVEIPLHVAYRVNQELLDRETTREEKIGRVTPEHFYSFRHEAEWLGIFRDWDARRSFHDRLLKQVLDANQSGQNCPAAAIIGPGGSGKSVALRRLAVDLHRAGHKVWWVEEPEEFIRFGISQLDYTGDNPGFVLIDEIQSVDDVYVGRLQRELRKTASVVLVVAGRRLPAILQNRVSVGNLLFVPDEAADHLAILEKIASTMPEWATTAHELMAESLRQARLIRLLVVIARQRAVPRNLLELEAIFLDILVDDLKRIYIVLPGLAEAVMDAAALREMGPPISRSTLIELADYRQPNASVRVQLQQFESNSRWDSLAPLLSYDAEHDLMQFHHGELVEGLILAGQRGLLQFQTTVDSPLRHLVIDNAWRRGALEIILQRGDFRTSSNALSASARHASQLLSQAEVLDYIRNFLASGNTHVSYLTLLVNRELTLGHQERLELLFDAARVAPNNDGLWGSVWTWICGQTQERRVQVLEQLYKAGCQSPVIMIQLLKHLSRGESRSLAKAWLAKENINPHVVCACLNRLGQEAKEDAKRLLNDSNDHEVLCTCLNLLGPEAKQDAKRLLKESNDYQVLCACLNLLGQEAKEDAKWLLKESESYAVQCICLTLLGQEAKEDAKRLLNESNNHPVLCACLNLLGQEAKEDAKRLLKESNDNSVLCSCLMLLGQEVKEDAKRLLNESSNFAVQCICLTLLGQDAREDAKRLLKENSSKEVQCICLTLLGAEAKEDARRLLNGSGSKEVQCICLTLLGAEAKEDAKRLLNGSSSKEVQCICLTLLGAEAKEDARRLLKESNSFEVQCICLTLLGSEAKEDATRLLKESNDKSVLCSSLMLLGQEAESYAIERIRKWTETDPFVLTRCFQIAGATPEAAAAATSILGAWDRGITNAHRIVALRAPFDTELRRQKAQDVLSNWIRTNRPLVTAALIACWEHPEVVGVCREIMGRWHGELLFRKSRGLAHYEGHIAKAMSHPDLQQEALKVAYEMIFADWEVPGSITPMLQENIGYLLRSQWPLWGFGQLEDEVTSDVT